MPLSAQQRAILRQRCQEDLFFLTREVLGYEKLTEGLHRPICQLAQLSGKKSLLLLPRGFYKTTIVSIADTIQRFLKCLDSTQPQKNPTFPVSILLVTSTYENVVPWIAKVKEHIERNDVLHELFPELEPNPRWWRENTIRLKGQRIAGLVGGNLDGIGIGGEATGRHYSTVKFDDVVNKDNARSGTRRQEIKTYHAMMQPILAKGQEFIVGTRYHYDDLYGKLLNDESYQKTVMSCWGRDGKSIFPEEYPDDELLAIKRGMREHDQEGLGSWLFAAQYENEPTPSEEASFKEMWIKSYIALPEGLHYDVVMCVDPSTGLEHGDPAGITVVAVATETDDWYVIHSESYRYRPQQLVERIFALNKHFRPRKIALETNAYQATIKQLLEDERRRRQLHLPIKEMKAESLLGKEARIAALIAKFEFGNVYLRPKDMTLRQELRYWPNWKTDDVLDALAYVPYVRGYGVQKGFSGYALPGPPKQQSIKDIVQSGARMMSEWL